MKMSALSTLAALASAVSIPLATFDGAAGTTVKFVELNDPVMGGKSTGSWKVANGTGIFQGEVVDVPSLSAPGFIKAAGDSKYPDISSLILGDLILKVRTTTPEYKGFRVTFASGTISPSYSCAGGGSIPLSRGCFKTKFSVPAGEDFTEIRLPFNSFSDMWSPATGELTKTCQEDPSVCPTKSSLAGISRIEVWGEGALGKVDLEIMSISAGQASLGAADIKSRPPPDQDTCNAAVQSPLLFGIEGRTSPDVPVAVDANETLATAVCCDARVKPFAEPQFLFDAPDIQLFTKIDKAGVTTFFDSVCGLPLFRAPVNRTFDDFKADTEEHGWPSFRTAEVIFDNVVTDKTSTYVTSKCGTHLGSFLPDDKGDRWCIDLSCIAGNKK